MLAAE